jgi:hypothetical protein
MGIRHRIRMSAFSLVINQPLYPGLALSRRYHEVKSSITNDMAICRLTNERLRHSNLRKCFLTLTSP